MTHESTPAVLGLSDQLGLLPLSPHDHPDPQVMVWSEMEMQAIRRYASACVAAERERCIAACTEVMNAYGGDPAGRLLSGDRVRMQHQLQASGAAQCIDRIKA